MILLGFPLIYFPNEMIYIIESLIKIRVFCLFLSFFEKKHAGFL